MRRNKKRDGLHTAALAAVVMLAALLVAGLAACGGTQSDPTPSPTPASDSDLTPVVPASETDLTPSIVYPASGTDLTAALPLDLGNGLTLVQAGYYTGVFTADGSLETVYNVLGVTVRNESGQTLESARLTLGEAVFDLSLLPDGEEAMFAEAGRTLYAGALPAGEPVLTDTVWLAGETLPAGAVEATVSGGQVTVRNASGEALPAGLTLYFGYESVGGLIGGAVLEARLEEALAPDAQAQLALPDAIDGATRLLAAVAAD